MGMMAGFTIELDYRFDASGFCTPAIRQALEYAASIWEQPINDEFQDVESGISLNIENPESGTNEQISLGRPIDDLLVFVGSRSDLGPSVLARGGYQSGSTASVFSSRLTSSDFEPFIGYIFFDRSDSWFVDTSPETEVDIPFNSIDFISVAIHEIGHALGMTDNSPAPVTNGGLSGYNCLQSNGGIPIPYSSSGHFEEGFGNNTTVMDPITAAGRRTYPSKYDLAWLSDIGYEITPSAELNFVKQGTRAPLSSPSDDLYYGTNIRDEYSGMQGNDEIIGDDGDDFLGGNEGEDHLFGGSGNDKLIGGEGNDQLSGDDGDDFLSGNDGEDHLFGGMENDNLIGGLGNDEINGNEGDDQLIGDEGSDFLFGGTGNDKLIGGDGNDQLSGNDGIDFLAGTTGDDSLWGNSGADIFVFRRGDGRDTIGDFDFTQDAIALDPDLGFTDGNDFMARGLIEKPFSNVSRITLGLDSFIDIFHESMQGSPLQAANISISRYTLPDSSTIAAPTRILLPDYLLDENTPSGGVVGTLLSEDTDKADSFIYSLVRGIGDTDNTSFSIDGSQLRIISPTDFEARKSYSVRLRTTDRAGLFFEESLTIEILDLNEKPSDISVSTGSLDENIQPSSFVALLDSVDPDASDTFTYALVTGIGSTDNAAFSISGNQLKIVNSPDFETKSSYIIRLRTTDSGGLSFDKVLSLNVNDLAESSANIAPTNLSISRTSFNENIAAGTAVGILSSSDPDASDTFTYALVAGIGSTDNAAFSISGNQLKIINSPDFETKSSYSIRLRTTDAGGLSFEKAIDFSVNDLPESITGGTGSVINLATTDDIINFSAESFSELRSTPVTGFDPAKDTLSLNRSTFKNATSNRIFAIRPITFSGNKKRDRAARKLQSKLVKSVGMSGDPFIYNQITGQLIYDENGKLPGLGSGGAFAIFTDKPFLTSSDLLLS